MKVAEVLKPYLEFCVHDKFGPLRSICQVSHIPCQHCMCLKHQHVSCSFLCSVQRS